VSGEPTPPPESASSVDLSDEDVHWDLGSSLSYGDYLRLDRLLEAQKPLSTEHDEMLFIVVHQVSELWIRLMLHELTAVIECVRRDDLDPSFKLFDRIGRVQGQLLAVWDVLSTMTPSDYSSFRNLLGRSSGFQSLQ
jgi:tryptophan 2,3-dioxygenase